jgi:hypothetical protein
MSCCSCTQEAWMIASSLASAILRASISSTTGPVGRQPDALVRLRHGWSLPPPTPAFYPQLAGLLAIGPGRHSSLTQKPLLLLGQRLQRHYRRLT